MSVNYTIATDNTVARDQLEQLYSSVAWGAYTQDAAGLHQAVANSSFVVTAWADTQLIGLARALSDDVSVFFLQDILVRPDWQRKGVGTALISRCIDRFAHVRQRILLTDNQPSQHRFYESAGYADTRRISNIKLHTFVNLSGIDLEIAVEDGSATGN